MIYNYWSKLNYSAVSEYKANVLLAWTQNHPKSEQIEWIPRNLSCLWPGPAGPLVSVLRPSANCLDLITLISQNYTAALRTATSHRTAAWTRRKNSSIHYTLFTITAIAGRLEENMQDCRCNVSFCIVYNYLRCNSFRSINFYRSWYSVTNAGHYNIQF